MRKYYPYCFLIGDNSKIFQNICKSLRFSSHCRYIVLSKQKPFLTKNYAFMKWINIEDFNYNEFDFNKNSFYIYFTKNEFNFGIIKLIEDLDNLINYFKKSTKFIKQEEGILDSLIKNQKLFEAIISEFFQVKNSEKIYLEFLVDYKCKLNFLYGSKFSDSRKYSLIEKSIHHKFQSEINKIDVIKNNINKLFSIEISKKGLKKINLNMASKRWEIARSIGINIPLIIVQNLMQRDIKTFYFIDEKIISFDDYPKSIKYNFNFKKLYFDLDETLIWENIPNKNIMEYFLKFYKAKIPIKLITRHKYSIKDTLKKINLNEKYFEEIIKILPHQKKSSFIKENAIFIDNEFPERLDVLLNCNIPSLDLDQFDFIEGI